MGCTPKQPCAIPVNELPCVGLEVGPFEPRAEPSGLGQMETAGGRGAVGLAGQTRSGIQATAGGWASCLRKRDSVSGLVEGPNGEKGGQCAALPPPFPPRGPRSLSWEPQRCQAKAHGSQSLSSGWLC